MMMSSAHPERPSSFVYSSKPARVIFGSGTISRLGDELATACISRPLFLSSPQQLRRVDEIRTKAFKGGSACHFAGAVMHTPVEVTEQALSLALKNQVDGIVAIGGGSTIGLAKAIALRTDLPQLVVPTTYAGSEMTAILGETRDGVKSTRSDPSILPEVVLYDVDLTLTLPPRVAAASGVNAMAHAVEALYARERNPIISMMAQEAIRARTLCMAHGSAVCVWAPWAWRCITNCVMCWGDYSISPTLRLTRFFCHMHLLTMPRQCPRPHLLLRRRWAWRTRQMAYIDS
jgi:alcohol dehydrogenase class IV